MMALLALAVVLAAFGTLAVFTAVRFRQERAVAQVARIMPLIGR